MIEKTQAYKTADGMTHASLDVAQRHSLIKVFNDSRDASTVGAQAIIADAVMENASSVIAILSTKARKPRAKKAAGVGKKKAGKEKEVNTLEP